MIDLEGQGTSQPVSSCFSALPSQFSKDLLKCPPCSERILKSSLAFQFPADTACLVPPLTVEEKALVTLAHLFQHDSSWA